MHPVGIHAAYPQLNFELKEIDYAENLSLPLEAVKELIRHNLLEKFLSYHTETFWLKNALPCSIAHFIECVEKTTSSQELFHLMTTPQMELKEMEKRELEEIPSYSQDSEFIRKNRYGDQDRFDIGMHAAINEAVDHLRSHNWNFSQLFFFFAYRRYLIAKEAEMDLFNDYGQLSNKQINTWCDNAYEALDSRFQKMHLEISSPCYDRRENEWKQWGYYLFHNIDISYITERWNRYTFKLCYVFVHSPPENLPKLFPFLENAYEESIREDNLETLTPKLGFLFWLICMSKPCNRGEVAIAEMFIKTILIFKGYEPNHWKENVIPWCEVVCQPDPTLFAEDFKNLFVTDCLASSENLS